MSGFDPHLPNEVFMGNGGLLIIKLPGRKSDVGLLIGRSRPSQYSERMSVQYQKAATNVRRPRVSMTAGRFTQWHEKLLIRHYVVRI